MTEIHKHAYPFSELLKMHVEIEPLMLLWLDSPCKTIFPPAAWPGKTLLVTSMRCYAQTPTDERMQHSFCFSCYHMYSKFQRFWMCITMYNFVLVGCNLFGGKN
ncbi:hypothetical protein ILYODFUR_033047 [Ilyodon furcidens]|uniref:Uncharacterized protein n=1 Tax=Ilyodon furcidens TaxID=33524 RepID=A0ABV0TQM9_9TELE